MGIKNLGFREIRRRAVNFRRVASSLRQQFDIRSADAEKFLEENSLAPIVGTICDEQIIAEDAWQFPYWLSKQFDKEKISAQLIYNTGRTKIKELLSSFMENRWAIGMTENARKEYLEKVSRYLIDTCSLIITQYNNDPDKMFEEGGYTVPEVYFILRMLPGIGPKKASMIARDFVKGDGPWYKGIRKRLRNIGVEFKVRAKHLSGVPVDVQVVKVFGRIMGEFKKTPAREKFLNYWPDIQNFAKVAFPDFPGKIDELLWKVGREYCDERCPNCEECSLRDIPCEYVKKLGK